ncbi:MAG: hypothetical protein JWM78_993 [Verrucomicrobiaceae bacterium]|nr:hypothetical protein [Verrucomicrobiaceae bacterium]
MVKNHNEPDNKLHTVALSSGLIEGFLDRGALVFLGIPYGASTADEFRFQPPRPALPWSGVRKANAFGPKCPQPPLPLPPGFRDLILFADLPQSEDCLNLNVWTAAAEVKTPRPVVVWLHGGAFTSGTGAEPDYDGANLATRNDVVVVTLNHRLNVFGFLDLSQSGIDAFSKSANAGMLDIVLALEWIKNNIAQFGGDPANVTVFGQSGGGVKVSTLLSMPAAQRLFQKAVVQSAHLLDISTVAHSAEISKDVLKKLEITAQNVAALQALSVEQLLQATADVQFTPTVDGTVVIAQPMAASLHLDVPVIIGWTADEMTVFLLPDPHFAHIDEAALRARVAEMVGAERADAAIANYREKAPDDSPGYLLASFLTDQVFMRNALTLADRKLKQGGAAVFLYRLDWRSPVLAGALRATHGIDMAMWFDNCERKSSLINSDSEAIALGKYLSGALVAFAHTGKPNSSALPSWPAYTHQDRQTLIFDITPQVISDPMQQSRDFLK